MLVFAIVWMDQESMVVSARRLGGREVSFVVRDVEWWECCGKEGHAAECKCCGACIGVVIALAPNHSGTRLPTSVSLPFLFHARPLFHSTLFWHVREANIFREEVPALPRVAEKLLYAKTGRRERDVDVDALHFSSDRIILLHFNIQGALEQLLLIRKPICILVVSMPQVQMEARKAIALLVNSAPETLVITCLKPQHPRSLPIPEAEASLSFSIMIRSARHLPWFF